MLDKKVPNFDSIRCLGTKVGSYGSRLKGPRIRHLCNCSHTTNSALRSHSCSCHRLLHRHLRTGLIRPQSNSCHHCDCGHRHFNTAIWLLSKPPSRPSPIAITRTLLSTVLNTDWEQMTANSTAEHSVLNAGYKTPNDLRASWHIYWQAVAEVSENPTKIEAPMDESRLE